MIFGTGPVGCWTVRVEMMHQFVNPFVVEADAFERTFGLSATPLREGLARTVAWY